VRNVTEAAVRREFERLRDQFPDFCGCRVCSDDVLVYALNRLPPRYVISPAGGALTEVSFDKDQSKAAVNVVLIEALRRVTAAPRCGRAPPPNSG